MAAVSIERQPTDAGGDGSLIKCTWILTTADPQGVFVAFPEYADKTLTIGMESGDAFGAATCVIQGKNTVAATAATLNKAATGTAASFTAAGVVSVIENTVFIAPLLSVVGAGATVTVVLLARRANPLRQ